MNHFIVSRFNINHFFYVNHNLKKALSQSWFKERIDLFYRYTYPSILNQSIKDFHWLILVDDRTNKELVRELLDRDVSSLFTLVFVGDSDYLKVLKEKIIHLSNRCDDIITTSLDTDDGVSPNFVKDVQFICKSSKKRLPFGINFNRGFIVDCNTGIFFKKSFLSNPFYSLIESRENFFTVCQYPHHLLSNHFDTINYHNSEYWFQNIHGGNFGNVIKGFPIPPSSNSYQLVSSDYISPTWKDYFSSILEYANRKFKNGVIKIFRLFK